MKKYNTLRISKELWRKFERPHMESAFIKRKLVFVTVQVIKLCSGRSIRTFMVSNFYCKAKICFFSVGPNGCLIPHTELVKKLIFIHKTCKFVHDN